MICEWSDVEIVAEMAEVGVSGSGAVRGK